MPHSMPGRMGRFPRCWESRCGRAHARKYLILSIPGHCADGLDAQVEGAKESLGKQFILITPQVSPCAKISFVTKADGCRICMVSNVKGQETS